MSVIGVLATVGLMTTAAQGTADGSRFDGRYRCTSMMGPDTLDVTLTRVGDQRIVRATRENLREKRRYVLVERGVVTDVKKVEGEGSTEEWTFAFQSGSLEIDVTPDGTLNMIVTVGDTQRAFWPCLKSVSKPDTKS